MDRIRQVMIAGGLSEAMTPSISTAQLDQSISPWTDRPALQTQTPLLKGARHLRRSLLPSLLEARAKNWSSASMGADLFEIAHVYLPGEGDSLPNEQYSLGMVSGRDFFAVKGIVETLCQRMGIADRVHVEPGARPGLAAGGVIQTESDSALLGFIGIVDPKLLKTWKLPEPVVVAELSLPALLERAQLVPQQQAISIYPSIQRDLNFIVSESVRWSEMENVVRAAVGAELASLHYRETYRDHERDGKNNKRVLMTVELQRHDATLSGQQADELVNKVIDACGAKLSAKLLS
jgi:phenylalanyl-tRNA synthetase beta chain